MSRIRLKSLVIPIFAWFLFTCVAFFEGNNALKVFTPILGGVVNIFNRPFASRLQVVSMEQGDVIGLLSRAKSSIPLVSGMKIPANTRIYTNLDTLHVLAPVVLLFTFLVCLPAGGLKNWLFRASLVLMLSIAMIVLGTPALLVGKTQMYIQSVIEAAGLARPIPPVMLWMLFWELGGMWLPPLLFIVVVLMRNRYKNPLQTSLVG